MGFQSVSLSRSAGEQSLGFALMTPHLKCAALAELLKHEKQSKSSLQNKKLFWLHSWRLQAGNLELANIQCTPVSES